MVTGQFVDPRSGRVTFRDYAERWRAGQVHRLTTVAYVEGKLRQHAYPVLGDRPLSSVRPSDIQAWVKGMTDRLAPSTVGTVHGVVSGIFRAAVRDRLIVANPCEGDTATENLGVTGRAATRQNRVRARRRGARPVSGAGHLRGRFRHASG